MPMEGIRKMVTGVTRRLAESYKTLVIDKSKRLNIVSRLLITAFAFFCYLLVALIIAVILLIVLFIALPLSFFYQRLR